MKKFTVVLFLLGIAPVLIAQKQVTDPAFDAMLQELLEHTVTEVIPSDVLNDDSVIYLDARLKKEFEVSHIKGARWVGFQSFKSKRVGDLNRDQKIVVYCTVGYRSEKIAEKLVKEGFTDVSNLFGGIFEWMHVGGELVNEDGATTDVHTYDSNWGQWLQSGNKVN